MKISKFTQFYISFLLLCIMGLVQGGGFALGIAIFSQPKNITKSCCTMKTCCCAPSACTCTPDHCSAEDKPTSSKNTVLMQQPCNAIDTAIEFGFDSTPYTTITVCPLSSPRFSPLYSCSNFQNTPITQASEPPLHPPQS